MAIWNILQTFWIFYGHLVHCFNLVHFSGFGTKYREKSGNPSWDEKNDPFFAAKFSIRNSSVGINRLRRLQRFDRTGK
jgi:hypothetical protein